jgi:hypothetical protein
MQLHIINTYSALYAKALRQAEKRIYCACGSYCNIYFIALRTYILSSISWPIYVYSYFDHYDSTVLLPYHTLLLIQHF